MHWLHIGCSASPTEDSWGIVYWSISLLRYQEIARCFIWKWDQSWRRTGSGDWCNKGPHHTWEHSWSSSLIWLLSHKAFTMHLKHFITFHIWYGQCCCSPCTPSLYSVDWFVKAVTDASNKFTHPDRSSIFCLAGSKSNVLLLRQNNLFVFINPTEHEPGVCVR